jgi:hypothetical protein
MSRIGRIGILALALAFATTPGFARAADAPSRTFNAPVGPCLGGDGVGLRSLGWEIDTSTGRWAGF